MIDGFDHEAPTFERWYAEAADGLVRSVAASIGDPLLAREATAEALARAYERWDRVGLMDSPAGWVHNTAVNLCRRSWRRRLLERRAVEKAGRLDSGPGDDRANDVTEIRVQLAPLVADLPPRMNQAVRLRYWSGMTEPEVATAMNVSVGTASALLTQARQRLGRNLEQLEPVEPSQPSGRNGVAATKTTATTTTNGERTWNP